MPTTRMRDGAKLHLRRLGKGPAIVFLHGFGMQSLHWLPFALPLARKHTVIIPDLRGFGESHTTNFSSECILSQYAQDLHDLLQHEGIERFALVGISMGALASLKYIEQYGDAKISAYLHIDQSPRCLNSEEWKWGLFGEQQAVRLKKAAELIANFQPYVHAGTKYADLPKTLRQDLWTELGEFYASALSSEQHKQVAKKVCGSRLSSRLLPTENWPVYLHCLRAYLEQDYDLRESLSTIRKPLQVLVGMKSEMYPPGGQLRIADHVPHCELLTFQNSGHTPLIDQPVRFMRTLAAFAKRYPARV